MSLESSVMVRDCWRDLIDSLIIHEHHWDPRMENDKGNSMIVDLTLGGEKCRVVNLPGYLGFFFVSVKLSFRYYLPPPWSSPVPPSLPPPPAHPPPHTPPTGPPESRGRISSVRDCRPRQGQYQRLAQYERKRMH